MKKRKIAISNFLSSENINQIAEQLKCQDLNEVYINLGNGKFTPTQVINVITDENITKEEMILNKTKDKEVKIPHLKNDIIVKGIDDIKVNLASCCKPINGDRIVGYITKGHGITVHRMACPNVSELEERLIEVKWNNTVRKYPTSLLIKSLEDKNILMEIVAKTSNSDITIESIKSLSSGDNYAYQVTVLVENKAKLLKYMNDLNMIPHILKVERLIK